MREALRRLLWLAPTLVVVTILAFWAVSRALSTEPGDADLPLFFNPEPVGVREIAWRAVETIAEGAAGRDAAEATLVRLGGAALPHVLPRLDSLSPEGRQRVAGALTPVAARMGTSIDQTLRTTDSASEFWRRFWDEHFVDFNDSIVRRVVRRYADRGSLHRQRELMRLDGFALDELLTQMNELERPEQVPSLRRLMAAAAHVTGQDWTLPADATYEQAREVNGRWQAWWAVRRNEYVTLHGVERLLSPLLQTRYAIWVRESVRTEFGVLSGGRPALDELKKRAPVTLRLFFVGLFGGTALGILLGALATVLRARLARLLESLLGFLWVAIPLALIIGYGTPQDGAMRELFGSLLMLLVGVSLVARYQRTQTSRLLRQEWVRCYRALGASRALLALLTLRASSSVALSAVAPHTSTLLTAVFVIEFAFGIAGVGPTTIAALSEHEHDWLMLVTVATAALVGVLQIASDLVLTKLDPRRRRASLGGADG